jgi:hypothetical protein
MLHFKKKGIITGFITGGIGDAIAVDSFLDLNFRKEVSTFFYATWQKRHIENLFGCLKGYPNLKHHISLFNDFQAIAEYPGLKPFTSLSEFYNLCKDKKDLEQYNLSCSCDLSIATILEKIESNKIQYTDSSFIKEKLIDVSRFNLLKPYYVILPYSQQKMGNRRDFNKEDWNQTLNILNVNNSYGVIINVGDKEKIPKNPMLLNLSNQTSLVEGIEILKEAQGFLGIDSWLSVLAAKIFDEPNLQIKTCHEHVRRFASLYFAPKTNFNFLVPQIKT